ARRQQARRPHPHQRAGDRGLAEADAGRTRCRAREETAASHARHTIDIRSRGILSRPSTKEIPLSVQTVIHKDGSKTYKVRWREGGSHRARHFGRLEDARTWDAEVRRRRQSGDLV